MTKAKIIRNYFKKFYNVDVEGMTPIAALRDAYYKVWGIRADGATLSALLDYIITNYESLGGGAASVSQYGALVMRTIETAGPKEATSVGDYAFYGCVNLREASFENVYIVGEHAFEKCTSVTNIILPKVTLIGEYAFAGCTKFERLVLGADRLCVLTDVNAFDGTKFEETNNIHGATLYVRESLMDDYLDAIPWKTIIQNQEVVLRPIEDSEYKDILSR